MKDIIVLWIKASIVGGFIIIPLLFFYSSHIDTFSERYLYSSLNEIPYNKVGLLLWTSKYIESKRYYNLFYVYRIDATVKLYNAWKIDSVLVSGDNSTEGYDEATDMQQTLIKEWIPEERIFLDYAGFRTLDSVIRAREIFEQAQFTIISQKFHTSRAVYIARKNWIEAIWYNAQDVRLKRSFRVRIREVFARGKVFIDLLFWVQPKFLGEIIKID